MRLMALMKDMQLLPNYMEPNKTLKILKPYLIIKHLLIHLGKNLVNCLIQFLSVRSLHKKEEY